jgi:hypothetical protein
MTSSRKAAHHEAHDELYSAHEEYEMTAVQQCLLSLQDSLPLQLPAAGSFLPLSLHVGLIM